MKRVDIFTDGACKGNPGPGGWAALLRMGPHEKVITGGETHTSAVLAIEGLKARRCVSRRGLCSNLVQIQAHHVFPGILICARRARERESQGNDAVHPAHCRTGR